MRSVHQTHLDHISKPLPISLGGTGEKTAEQALAALTGVPHTTIGHTNGPVPLNSNGLIDVSHLPAELLNRVQNPGVMGPSKLYIGAMRRFWITDYDIDTNYAITSTIGDIILAYDERETTSNPFVIELSIPYDELLIGQNCILNVNETELILPIVASFIIDSGTAIFSYGGG